ncbi:MAG TPA: hypothetical protein VFS67_16190 [Polyangiaceae bacterium]|nr:hypothetical protein [Polyangiaceae bacterium]
MRASTECSQRVRLEGAGLLLHEEPPHALGFFPDGWGIPLRTQIGFTGRAEGRLTLSCTCRHTSPCRHQRVLLEVLLDAIHGGGALASELAELVAVPDWQRLPGALARTPKARQVEPQQRLVWRVGRAPERFAVQPLLKQRNARGQWSAGRRLDAQAAAQLRHEAPAEDRAPLDAFVAAAYLGNVCGPAAAQVRLLAEPEALRGRAVTARRVFVLRLRPLGQRRLEAELRVRLLVDATPNPEPLSTDLMPGAGPLDVLGSAAGERVWLRRDLQLEAEQARALAERISLGAAPERAPWQLEGEAAIELVHRARAAASAAEARARGGVARERTLANAQRRLAAAAHPPLGLLRSGFDDAQPELLSDSFPTDVSFSAGPGYILTLQRARDSGYHDIGLNFVRTDDSGCRSVPGPRGEILGALALDTTHAYWSGYRQSSSDAALRDNTLHHVDLETGAVARLNLPGIMPDYYRSFLAQDDTRLFLWSDGALLSVRKP